MRRFYRGNNVVFTASFIDTPSTVNITLHFPTTATCVRETTWATYALTATSTLNETWTYSWDSLVAGPGYIYYNIRGDNTDDDNIDGQFEIRANPANLAYST